jgi:DNA-binding Lrp family transcriptional regulator
MRKALVCINTSLDSVEEVAQELRACDEVKEVFLVHGVYDILAKVEGETLDDITSVINRRIRSLRKVHSTLSLLLLEPKKSVPEKDLILV